MENVANLVTKTHKHVLRMAIDILGKHYHIEWSILNSLDYGLPQNRKRIWVIGVHKDSSYHTIEWPPKDGKPPNSENFLDPKTATERDVTQLPLPTTKTAACQLKFAEAKFKDLDNQTIFVDTGVGVNRPTSALGHSPCIIRARGPIGFWISNRRREMSVHECALPRHS